MPHASAPARRLASKASEKAGTSWRRHRGNHVQQQRDVRAARVTLGIMGASRTESARRSRTSAQAVAFDIIEWPVAVLTLAAHVMARSRFKALRGMAELLEEAG